MTGYQNFNGTNANLGRRYNVSCSGRREEAQAKSFYDRMLDLCCIIVLFFEKKAVRRTVSVLSASGFVISAFLLISAALRGAIAFAPAIGLTFLIAVVAALFIRITE